MSDLIAWLDEGRVITPDLVGGKAASLARLSALGLPVPPGFAVTVAGYRAFHALHDLDSAVSAVEALVGRPTPAEVRDACAPLLARLEGASLPPALESAIIQAFDGLQSRAGQAATFAVRSSGVSEDSAGASFAGLYDSYLNLRARDEVLEAVLKCYRCLWDPRAVHYRAIKGFRHAGEAMAVVVMETVASQVSGVAFTMNPVTGTNDEVVINASWGLGEAVVAGIVTPDSFVVRKEGQLVRSDIAEKDVRVVPVPGGTERQDTPEHLISVPSLTEDQVLHVARTAMEVEVRYGMPVDVEFAYDADGEFFLLQARPVTTR